MFKKENFQNKTEHKYQNREKRKWGVLTLHRQDRSRVSIRDRGGWGVKKRRWFVHDLDH